MVDDLAGGPVRRGGATVELLVDLTPIRSELFSWRTSFNGSYNKTKVLKLLTERPGGVRFAA